MAWCLAAVPSPRLQRRASCEVQPYLVNNDGEAAKEPEGGAGSPQAGAGGVGDHETKHWCDHGCKSGAGVRGLGV